MKLANLYVDPLEFFRDEMAPGKTSLRAPTSIVTALLAVGMLDVYLTQHSVFGFLAQSIQVNTFLSGADKEMMLSQFQGIKPIAISAASFASCYPLFMWFAVPAFLASAAILLNRDYHFREMLRCTGLALLVFFPGQILSTIMLCWSPHVAYNPVSSSRNLGELATDLGVLSRMIRGGFPSATVRDLNVFGFIWFGVVLTIGFRQLYRVKWPAAIFSVWGIPALFYAGGLLVSHLGAMTF